MLLVGIECRRETTVGGHNFKGAARPDPIGQIIRHFSTFYPFDGHGDVGIVGAAAHAVGAAHFLAVDGCFEGQILTAFVLKSRFQIGRHAEAKCNGIGSFLGDRLDGNLVKMLTHVAFLRTFHGSRRESVNFGIGCKTALTA